MKAKSRFWFRSLIVHSPEEIYNWHLRPRAIERVIPHTEKIEVFFSTQRNDLIGSKLVISAKFLKFIWTKLTVQYSGFCKNESLTLHQIKGVFDECKHEMRIISQSTHDPNSNASELIDKLEYSYFAPWFTIPFINFYLKRLFTKIITHKHELIDHDIATMQKYHYDKPFKILVIGRHESIEKKLVCFLEFMGHNVKSLSRDFKDEEKGRGWDPKAGKEGTSGLEGFDVIIHLKEKNNAKGLFTKENNAKELASHKKKVEKLVDVIHELEKPPNAFLLLSAINVNGDYFDKWKEEKLKLQEKGIKMAHIRFENASNTDDGIFSPRKKNSGYKCKSRTTINDALNTLYHVMMNTGIRYTPRVSKVDFSLHQHPDL